MKKKKTESESSSMETSHYRLNQSSRDKFRDLIIERLREVDDNWQQPWLNVNRGQLSPRNLYADKPFRGMNAFITAFECDIAGYRTPYYLTLGQIKNTEGKFKYSDLSINSKLDWLSDDFGDLGMPASFETMKENAGDVLSVLLRELERGIARHPEISVTSEGYAVFGTVPEDVRDAVRSAFKDSLPARGHLRKIADYVGQDAFFESLEGKAIGMKGCLRALTPYYDERIAERMDLNEKLVSLLHLDEGYTDQEGNSISREEFLGLSLDEQRKCSHQVAITEDTPDIRYKNYYYRISGEPGFISSLEYGALSKQEKTNYRPFEVTKTYEAPTPIVFFSPFYYNPDGDPKRLTVEQWKALETDEEREEYELRFTEKVTIEYNLDQTNFAELYPEDFKALVEKSAPKSIDSLQMATDVKVPVFDRMISDPDAWITDHVYVGEEGVSRSHIDDAFYHPAQEGAEGIAGTHYIHLPDPRTFDTMQHYYSTAAHEFTHSTMIKKPRDYGKQSWGDHGYALEEFVAEIGSAAICLQLGIERTVSKDNLQYIKSWIKSCDETPEVIGKIIDDVWDATDVFMGKYNHLEREMAAQGEETAITGDFVSKDAAEDNFPGKSYLDANPSATRQEADTLCRNLSGCGYMDSMSGCLTNRFYNDMRNGKLSEAVWSGLEDDGRERAGQYINKVFESRPPVANTDTLHETDVAAVLPQPGNTVLSPETAEEICRSMYGDPAAMPTDETMPMTLTSPIGTLDLTVTPFNQAESAIFMATAAHPDMLAESAGSHLLAKAFRHDDKLFVAAIRVNAGQLERLLMTAGEFADELTRNPTRLVWTPSSNSLLYLRAECRDFASKLALYNFVSDGRFASTAEDASRCLSQDIFIPGTKTLGLDGREDTVSAAVTSPDGQVTVRMESGAAYPAESLCRDIAAGNIGYGTPDDTRAVGFLMNPHLTGTALPAYQTGDYFSLQAAVESQKEALLSYLKSGITSVPYTIYNVPLCQNGYKKLYADVDFGKEPDSVRIRDLRICNFGQTSPAMMIEKRLQSTIGTSVLDIPLSTMAASMAAISKATVRSHGVRYKIGLQRTADSKWSMNVEKDKGKDRQRHDVLVK